MGANFVLTKAHQRFECVTLLQCSLELHGSRASPVFPPAVKMPVSIFHANKELKASSTNVSEGA